MRRRMQFWGFCVLVLTTYPICVEGTVLSYYTDSGGYHEYSYSGQGDEVMILHGKDEYIPETITLIKVETEFGNELSRKSLGMKKVIGICQSAFYGKDISNIVIPNSIREIGSSAFRGCENLISITLPSNTFYTEIERNTFMGCSSLKHIDIPNNIVKIGVSAFEGSGLTNIDLGGSIKIIEGTAFQKCNGLTSITIPPNIESIKYTAFWNCDNLTTMIINNNYILR